MPGVRLAIALTALVAIAAGGACRRDTIPVSGRDDAEKTVAALRAERRAYDGAPPIIPHEVYGDCTSCHDLEGVSVPGVGFAPPSPHEGTRGLNDESRCRQCHVNRLTDDRFIDSVFVPLRQDLRRGRRASAIAPPVIPHATFMRGNCLACHSGPAAREEIRTPHPERVRCRQCHVGTVTRGEFSTTAS